MAFVDFTYNPVPAPACYPPDINGLAQLLTDGGVLSGTIPDNSGGGIFVGTAPPSSSLTFRVWFKTATAGQPLGVYMFYNGNWRKVYTGVVIGEIRQYYLAPGSLFDSTGLGVIGGDVDGWALCNGANGTPDLHDYFIVASTSYGASNDGTGQVGWVTTTQDANLRVTGGARGPHYLGRQDLPQLYTSVHGLAQAATGTGAVTIADRNSPIVQRWEVTTADQVATGTPSQIPQPLPYFHALCYMMFVGYQ